VDRILGGIIMDKIEVRADEDGVEEATFNRGYNKKMLNKINEIVDWINSQG
jgi:hypothetical protein